MDQKEAELFKAFTESDQGLRIFLKQAIAISDDMLAKSTDAESKVAWLEMSIASRKLDCEACKRQIETNRKDIYEKSTTMKKVVDDYHRSHAK
jgi:hypothetical protein